MSGINLKVGLILGIELFQVMVPLNFSLKLTLPLLNHIKPHGTEFLGLVVSFGSQFLHGDTIDRVLCVTSWETINTAVK